MSQSTKLVVKKVPNGYQVFELVTPVQIGDPVNDKVYFHPTSAYAALGRIVHANNIKGLDTDPARAIKAEAK